MLSFLSLKSSRRTTLHFMRGSSSITKLYMSTTAEPPSVQPNTKGKKEKPKKVKSPYSNTVLLPVTGFDQRANAARREPRLQLVLDYWKT